MWCQKNTSFLVSVTTDAGMLLLGKVGRAKIQQTCILFLLHVRKEGAFDALM